MGLFESIVEKVMEAKYEEAEAVVSNIYADDSRRAAEYYQSIPAQELDLTEQFAFVFENRDEWDARPKTCYNLTAAVTDTLASLYGDAVRREFKEPRAAALWADIEGFDALMADVDAYTTITGIVAVRPFVDDQGKSTFAMYLAHHIDCLVDPKDPTVPLALRLSWNSGSGETSAVVAHTWVAPSISPSGMVEFVETVDDVVTEGPIEYPFPRIPITIFRNRRARWSFFDPPAVDLVNANLIHNSTITDLNWTVKWQTHGQLVMLGAPDGYKPKVGPSTYISSSDKEAKIFYLNPGADVQSAISSINKNLEMFFAARRIPKSAVLAQESNRSGISLIAEQTSLLDYRKKRIIIFRPMETELIQNSLMVFEYASSKRVVEFQKPTIYYTVPRAPMSSVSQSEWGFKFMHKISTPIDYIMEEQGIGREEAREIYAQNIAFFKIANPNPQEPETSPEDEDLEDENPEDDIEQDSDLGEEDTQSLSQLPEQPGK